MAIIHERDVACVCFVIHLRHGRISSVTNEGKSVIPKTRLIFNHEYDKITSYLLLPNKAEMEILPPSSFGVATGAVIAE